MDENKLLEQIKKSAEQTEVPESLQPEQIAAKLKGVRQQRRKRPLHQWAAAAAVVLIALVSVWQIQRIGSDMLESKQEDLTAETAVPETAAVQPAFDSGVTAAAGEEALYEALYENQYAYSTDQSLDYGGNTEAAEADMVAEEAAPEMGTGIVPEMSGGAQAKKESAATGQAETAAADSADQAGEFSTTNVQEEGVDEGDIVKTDGVYLYILKQSGEVRIVKTEQEKMDAVSTIQIPDRNIDIEEMYLDGGRLILIGSGTESAMEEEAVDQYAINQKQYTRMYTYDISSPKSPELSGTLEQEGWYRTSRKTGSRVYLFTEYFPVVAEDRDKSSILPEVAGKKMAADRIYLPGYIENNAYLVISSVDLQKPSQVEDSKAVVSAAQMFYVSTENIYIAMNAYSGGGEKTQIIKFGYKDGKITSSGVAEVSGYLNDQFSMNEYNGYLRVVSTEWQSSQTVNHLTVIDKDLKICGEIRNLAPGEDIRSARFMGDTGYFVTFRDMDPLFSVDLSDPTKPEVKGELKITGFSSYLHFYGENKLLGIGNEVDPETGEYKGIKLSMFDTTDMTDVTEADKFVIKDTHECPGLGNHNAIMINPEKNLFGFKCENSYTVFSYQEGEGFVNEFTYEVEMKDTYMDDVRGVYIGDILYIIEETGVKAFDMQNGFEQKAELKFL